MNLRKAAKGQPCKLKLPGCDPGYSNEKVVLCHRRGAGVAIKSSDEDAVLGCFSCHSQLDGVESDLPEPYDVVFERAKDRTHRHWRYIGVMK